jgi:serine/threonine-protein kinase
MVVGTVSRLGGSLGFQTSERYEALCDALVEAGDFDGGIAVCRDSIKAHPEDIHLRLSFAQMVERQGNRDGSIAIYRDAIAAHPQSVELHEGLAKLFERQGKTVESNVELDQVIVLVRRQLQAKEDVSTHRKLATAYLRRGQRQEAVAQLQRVIELDPKKSDACKAIAWDLATDHNPKRRDGTIAAEFATKACELTEWKDPAGLATLAAAHAESGDFDSAVKWQTKAIELLADQKEKEDYRTRLKLYQEKKPYHRSFDSE